MHDMNALHTLAHRLGVRTEYVDGLNRPVTPPPEALVRVCAALGAAIAHPDDAPEALRALDAATWGAWLPPVLVAWDGRLTPLVQLPEGGMDAAIHLESGERLSLVRDAHGLHAPGVLPWGHHRLSVERDGRREEARVISAPVEAWRRPGGARSWGVGTHLAALRSRRSRALGDLRDLESLGHYIAGRGGDLVTVLPLLPTFNEPPAEPSPYSPVSRLFWSELILDLGDAHRPVEAPARLDVVTAWEEVRAALTSWPVPTEFGEELARYARFRGAQARLGRNWRDWPAAARAGHLAAEHVDPDVERFHLAAQHAARAQLHELRERLERTGTRVGLDLAVGVHPDGYDPWSRPALFAEGMSIGAPPDAGFPSGQDWGFMPVLPAASRADGHAYFAASIDHQAGLAGVLRIDHIMALTRLYWIPHGFGLHEGTYVSYPAEELFAVLTLASHRHRCEIVGENLGTVPPEIGVAMPRHRVWGMYLAQFQSPETSPLTAPTADDVAFIGTHDTPTFAGWLAGADVGERVAHRLLDADAAPGVLEARARTAHALAAALGSSVAEPRAFLAALLEWLGRSASPLVVPWLEDLWLEPEGVNLPGTRSSERPNWQRPMRLLLDDLFADGDVDALLRRLDEARRAS